MGVSRIRHITQKNLEDFKSKDRISNLPDEVLTRILSMLPSKDAVATSTLSSRWKNLYKLLTFLELSIDKRVHCELRLPESLCENLVVLKLDCNFRLSVPKPLTFPSLKVLLFKGITFEGKSNISVLRKSGCELGDDDDEDDDDHVLNGILSRCLLLEELVIIDCELHLSQLRRHCVVRLHQMTCQNMVVLKLDSKFTLSVPRSVTFPRLKVLCLKEITFKGSRSLFYASGCELGLDYYHGLNSMLSVCPLLEELVLVGCDWNGGDLWFTNRWLRSLTLEDGLSGPIDQLKESTVYFELPNLVYFKYCVGLAEWYKIKDLSSVVDAHIVISFDEDDYYTEQILSETILALIGGVCRCHSLRLSRQCLEALTSGYFLLPIFCNLTQLELNLGFDVSWSDVLLDFLNCSPCLESLTLGQVVRKLLVSSDKYHIPTGLNTTWGGAKLKPSQRDGGFLLEAEAVPSCVESQLKLINIKNFRGFKGEKKMVKYFLKSSNILQEMVIHWDPKIRATDFLAMEEEILDLPKSSLLCSIMFK